MSDHTILRIRFQDVLKGLGLVALLYGVYVIWDILLLIFVSIIFAALIDPFAGALAKRRVPRGVAVFIVYILFFGIVGSAIGILTPVVAEEIPQLVQTATLALDDIRTNEWILRFFGDAGVSTLEQTQRIISSGASDGAVSGVFSTVSDVFGGIVSLLVVLVLTFYLVSQHDPLGKILRSLVPEQYLPYVSGLFARMQEKLGAWMRGQIVLSLTIGVIVTIGLSVVGVKHAAILGLLAALLEFIPILGPIFASLPALFFAFSGGGIVTFVIVLVMYIVIQQFENHILVPKVMQRAVGLNPIVSIIAILIGMRLAGILGVLLAIPVATALSVVASDVATRQRERKVSDMSG